MQRIQQRNGMLQPRLEVEARHAKNASFGDLDIRGVGENNIGNECNNVAQILARGVHMITRTRIQGYMVFVGDYG
jgi:hypothetical protein